MTLQLTVTQRHNASMIICALMLEASATTFPSLKGVSLRTMEKIRENPCTELSMTDFLRDPGVSSVLLDAMLGGADMVTKWYPLFKTLINPQSPIPCFGGVCSDSLPESSCSDDFYPLRPEPAACVRPNVYVCDECFDKSRVKCRPRYWD